MLLIFSLERSNTIVNKCWKNIIREIAQLRDELTLACGQLRVGRMRWQGLGEIIFVERLMYYVEFAFQLLLDV